MDNIGNALTKIRNAYMAGHKSVKIEITRKNKFLVEKLKELKIFENSDSDTSELIFSQDISSFSIKRISKPGRKIYLPFKNLFHNQRKQGVDILNTSKGVMSDKEAYNQKIGGEIICNINVKFK